MSGALSYSCSPADFPERYLVMNMDTNECELVGKL